jgi:hypothetical protein
VGTVVTVSGANFGTTQGTSVVRFNGLAAPPSSWSNTSIVVPTVTAAGSAEPEQPGVGDYGLSTDSSGTIYRLIHTSR